MCEHEAVEQVRGEMGEGDYFDAVTNSLDEPKLARLPQDYHNYVELDDSNRTDFRIVCRKCFLSTGWMKADAPGMPGVGKDFARKKWDEIKKFDAEGYSVFQRQTGLKH